MSNTDKAVEKLKPYELAVNDFYSMNPKYRTKDRLVAIMEKAWNTRADTQALKAERKRMGNSIGVPKRGKVVDIKARKAYAASREGGLCDCGCGRLGQQVGHILRGSNKTDELWNFCWICLHCHSEFDSKGIKTRVWMFDVLIKRGQCSVVDVLLAQFRFGFEYD